VDGNHRVLLVRLFSDRRLPFGSAEEQNTQGKVPPETEKPEEASSATLRADSHIEESELSAMGFGKPTG
jgi:hypothetical protein